MPDVGRFFNIDVLGQDYDYQTPYAFSENKVTNHIELEGLESVRIGVGGVPVTPSSPSYGSNTTGFHPVGTGAWTELKGMFVNNWNFWTKQAEINYGVITTVGSVAAQRILNSEGDSKKEEKKTTLDNNKSKGKKAEKDVTKELEEEFPDDEVLTQVTGKFKDGKTTKFDAVIVDGQTKKVKETNETKSGNGKLTKAQKRYRNGETVELTGKKAGAAKGQNINVNEIPDRVTRK